MAQITPIRDQKTTEINNAVCLLFSPLCLIHLIRVICGSLLFSVFYFLPSLNCVRSCFTAESTSFSPLPSAQRALTTS